MSLSFATEKGCDDVLEVLGTGYKEFKDGRWFLEPQNEAVEQILNKTNVVNGKLVWDEHVERMIKRLLGYGVGGDRRLIARRRNADFPKTTEILTNIFKHPKYEEDLMATGEWV